MIQRSVKGGVTTLPRTDKHCTKSWWRAFWTRHCSQRSQTWESWDILETGHSNIKGSRVANLW